MSAKLEDGILRVSLPKKEQNRLPKSNLIVIEKQKCCRLRGERFRSLFMFCSLPGGTVRMYNYSYQHDDPDS